MTRGRIAIALVVLAALGVLALGVRPLQVLRYERHLADPDPAVAARAALFLLRNGGLGRARLLRRCGEPRVAEALDRVLEEDAESFGDLLGPLLATAAPLGPEFEPAMSGIERIAFTLGPDAFVVHDGREVYYCWDPNPGTGGHTFGAPHGDGEPIRRLHAWASSLVHLGLVKPDDPALAALPPRPTPKPRALGVFGLEDVIVLPGSPAERIGLRSGDRAILYEGGVEILCGGATLQEAFRERPRTAIQIERGDERLTLAVRPEHFAGAP